MKSRSNSKPPPQEETLPEQGIGMQPGWEKYRSDITEFGLASEDADALLRILWDIMRRFVELGFDLDRIDLLDDIAGDESEDEVDGANTNEAPVDSTGGLVGANRDCRTSEVVQ